MDTRYIESVDARLASHEAYIDYQMQEARRAIPFLAKYMRLQNARVLEVGAGLGGKGIAYSLEGMQVTSLDLEVESLTRAAQAATVRGAGIRFLAADGTRLPFSAGYFDAVLLDSVIEHVKDPAALLAECARVLKRGGIAFVVFPPFYGPLSGHIDDYILIPWFHLLPGQMVRRTLLAKRERKGILTAETAFEVFESLNGLTARRFKQRSQAAGFHFAYWRVRPFLTHPGTRLVMGLAGAVRRPPRLRQVTETLARAWREFDLGTFLLFIVLAGISPLVFVPVAQEIAAGGCKAVLVKS